MLTGIQWITEAREEQIIERGFTKEHDAEHVDESLALAACSYAIPDTWQRTKRVPDFEAGMGYMSVPTTWPWSGEHWNPKSRLENLARAGALIAAEIDRIIAAGGNVNG